MRRDAEGVVLLLAGGALLRIGLTDPTPYLRPGWAWPLVLTGAGLVVLAGRAFREAYRTGADRPSGRGVNAWPLLLLALALPLLAPPPLGAWWMGRAPAIPPGADAATARLVHVGPAPASSVPTTTQPSLRLTLSRFVADSAGLRGRRVLLLGYVVPGSDGTAYLARLAIGCCAAGAHPVRVGLTGVRLTGPSASGWVEVTGTVADRREVDPVSGVAVPFLSVDSVRLVVAPEPPYEWE